jgi:hypothetical protein
MKIRLVEAEFFHADRQTDRHTNRHTDTKKIIVAFRSFAKGVEPAVSIRRNCEYDIYKPQEHLNIRLM